MDKGSIIAAQTVSHHIYGGNKREPWKESKISLNRTGQNFLLFSIKKLARGGSKNQSCLSLSISFAHKGGHWKSE